MPAGGFCHARRNLSQRHTLSSPSDTHDVHTLRARLPLLKAGVEKEFGPTHCLLSRPTTQQHPTPATGSRLRLLRTYHAHNGCGSRPYHASDSTSWQPEDYEDCGDDNEEEGEGDNLGTFSPPPAALGNQCDTPACCPGVDLTSAAHPPIDSPTAPPTRKTKSGRPKHESDCERPLYLASQPLPATANLDPAARCAVSLSCLASRQA